MRDAVKFQGNIRNKIATIFFIGIFALWLSSFVFWLHFELGLGNRQQGVGVATYHGSIWLYSNAGMAGGLRCFFGLTSRPGFLLRFQHAGEAFAFSFAGLAWGTTNTGHVVGLPYWLMILLLLIPKILRRRRRMRSYRTATDPASAVLVRAAARAITCA